MRQVIYLLIALGLLWPATSSAQIQITDAVRKSKELAGVRACMNTLVENGKKANFEVDRDGTLTWVIHPNRAPLVPLAAEAVKCVAEALPKNEIHIQKRTNLPHRVWSAEIDGFVLFCAMPEGPNTKDYISPLGGAGPKRAWFGISFACRIGKEIGLN